MGGGGCLRLSLGSDRRSLTVERERGRRLRLQQQQQEKVLRPGEAGGNTVEEDTDAE